MLLIPLQITWSSAEGIHGHLDGKASEQGFHHHDADSADHHAPVAGGIHDNHDSGGHHDGHCHHVFSMLVIEADLKLGETSLNGPPVRRLIAFTSYIPLLFDRPPLALL